MTVVVGELPISAGEVAPVTVPEMAQVIPAPARIPKLEAKPSEGAGIDVTVTVAVPKIVPWVALTVLGNVPVVLPAVKGAVSPVVPAGMVPPPAG